MRWPPDWFCLIWVIAMLMMNKPSIFIYISDARMDLLLEICAGIEEEGVPYEVREMPMQDVDALAYAAAEESVLGSGIGIVGDTAAMQLRKIPKGQNIFKIVHPGMEQCRALGANSARAVKRQKFKGNDV